MKVGFTTYDNVRVNAHFGSAKQIAIYEVAATGYNYLETVEFGGNLAEDGNEDKLVPKVAAVKDCTIVYTSAIGKSAASRLVANKITPLRTNQEDEAITDVLDELIKQLNGTPAPWLRKILNLHNKPKSFDFEDFEDDD
ncbi:MAG: nitrogen fixation protein NifX [Microcystaceae cyanobacterium]